MFQFYFLFLFDWSGPVRVLVPSYRSQRQCRTITTICLGTSELRVLYSLFIILGLDQVGSGQKMDRWTTLMRPAGRSGGMFYRSVTVLSSQAMQYSTQRLLLYEFSSWPSVLRRTCSFCMVRSQESIVSLNSVVKGILVVFLRNSPATQLETFCSRFTT